MAEFLGAFEQAVLLAILRLGDNSYGRPILHEVQTSFKRNVSAGAVYTTLDRLEKRGLLRSKLAEGAPVRGGRPRRYYSVTADGVRGLNDAHQAMLDMWASTQWPLRAER